MWLFRVSLINHLRPKIELWIRDGKWQIGFWCEGGQKWSKMEVVFRIQTISWLFFREFCTNDWWQFKCKYLPAYGSWFDVKEIMWGFSNFTFSFVFIQPEAIFICFCLHQSHHAFITQNWPLFVLIAPIYSTSLIII